MLIRASSCMYVVHLRKATKDRLGRQGPGGGGAGHIRLCRPSTKLKTILKGKFIIAHLQWNGQRPADKHDQGLIQVHCLCCSQSERITISCRSRAVSLVCSYFLYVYCICVYILNIDIRHIFVQYVNIYVAYVCIYEHMSCSVVVAV